MIKYEQLYFWAFPDAGTIPKAFCVFVIATLKGCQFVANKAEA